MKYLMSLIMFLFTCLAWGQVDEGLSAKQQNFVDTQTKMSKEYKQAFKKSLSKDQIAILKDNSRSVDERRKALRSSLSGSQQKILKNHKQLIRVKNRYMRREFNHRQKRQIRREIHKRSSFKSSTMRKRRNGRRSKSYSGVII